MTLSNFLYTERGHCSLLYPLPLLEKNPAETPANGTEVSSHHKKHLCAEFQLATICIQETDNLPSQLNRYCGQYVTLIAMMLFDFRFSPFLDLLRCIFPFRKTQVVVKISKKITGNGDLDLDPSTSNLNLTCMLSCYTCISKII